MLLGESDAQPQSLSRRRRAAWTRRAGGRVWLDAEA